MSRYVISQMDEASKLLETFGLKISGFYPGVSAVTENQKEVVLPQSGWEFVKPLLQELVMLRIKQKFSP